MTSVDLLDVAGLPEFPGRFVIRDVGGGRAIIMGLVILDGHPRRGALRNGHPEGPDDVLVAGAISVRAVASGTTRTLIGDGSDGIFRQMGDERVWGEVLDKIRKREGM